MLIKKCAIFLKASATHISLVPEAILHLQEF